MAVEKRGQRSFQFHQHFGLNHCQNYSKSKDNLCISKILKNGDIKFLDSYTNFQKNAALSNYCITIRLNSEKFQNCDFSGKITKIIKDQFPYFYKSTLYMIFWFFHGNLHYQNGHFQEKGKSYKVGNSKSSTPSSATLTSAAFAQKYINISIQHWSLFTKTSAALKSVTFDFWHRPLSTLLFKNPDRLQSVDRYIFF